MDGGRKLQEKCLFLKKKSQETICQLCLKTEGKKCQEVWRQGECSKNYFRGKILVVITAIMLLTIYCAGILPSTLYEFSHVCFTVVL